MARLLGGGRSGYIRVPYREAPMQFGAWLRATRLSRSPIVSQEALAAAARALDPVEDPSRVRRNHAGYSQTRISLWETGDAIPGLRQFVVLCRALELGPDERAAGERAWRADQLAGLPDSDT